MGVWLFFFEKRRLYGMIAIISGIAWYAIATQGIIPFFGGELASVERHIDRYKYLGNSFPEMVQNLLFKPELVLGKVFSWNNLEYLVLLLAPIIWGLSLSGLTPLISGIPCLALNFLAESQPQKDLVHQYSLPALPFLLLIVISSLAAGKGWLQNKRAIILWSLVVFLSLTRVTYFIGKYWQFIDSWQATKQAIALVQTQGSVFTTEKIAPHLSHRQLIKFNNANSTQIDELTNFDYVLINVRHPGWSNAVESASRLVYQLKNQPEFELKYHRDDVFLFGKY